LFDLERDPGETVNLAFLPAMRDIRDRLAAGLEAWQQEVADPMLAYRKHPAADA
jgi:hypothetical protein